MNALKNKLPPIGQLGPFIALAIACAFFAVTTERFFSAEKPFTVTIYGKGVGLGFFC